MAIEILSFDQQAYTHELENKVSRLEEENERLKRQKVCFVIANFLVGEYAYPSSRYLRVCGYWYFVSFAFTCIDVVITKMCQ